MVVSLGGPMRIGHRRSIAFLATLSVLIPALAASATRVSYAAEDGYSARSIMVADGQCLVDIKATLHLDRPRAGGLVGVRTRVDAQCRIVPERLAIQADVRSGTGGHLARPLMDLQHSCEGANDTYDAGAGLREWLDTWNTFTYNGSAVTSKYTWFYVGANSPYFTEGNVWGSDSGTIPAWYYWVSDNQHYYWWLSWDADKHNKLWVYGDGSISFEVQHYGGVPRGGWVDQYAKCWS